MSIKKISVFECDIVGCDAETTIPRQEGKLPDGWLYFHDNSLLEGATVICPLHNIRLKTREKTT
jgi:hypothetical protein